MLANILITVSVLVFTIVVPILEINASHVFNSTWPPHARFHEVWQLSTNFGIGILCLWQCWGNRNVKLSSLLVVLVMGGILVAHLLEGIYGGSILSGNLSKTVMGLELAAFAAVVSVALAVLAWRIDHQQNVNRV